MTQHKSVLSYARKPLNVVSGVPVFAKGDGYIENYDTIARDHLASLDDAGVNPFMSEQTWTALEQSTVSMMQDLLQPHDRILDAGVGLGRLLSQFPDHERHGIDIALEYLERTKDLGIHVALARLEDIPYPDDAFDMVVATDVLEHVLDLYHASCELARVLKPGGHLVLRVPFEEDMKAYYNYRDYSLVHVRRFDLWSLRIHFERIFGMEYVRHGMVLPKFRGLGTMRIAAMENGEAVRQILEQLPDDLLAVSDLKKFSHLKSEDLLGLMNAIAGPEPELFAALEAQLANYLEINIAFRKPLDPAAPHFGVRAGGDDRKGWLKAPEFLRRMLSARRKT